MSAISRMKLVILSFFAACPKRQVNDTSRVFLQDLTALFAIPLDQGHMQGEIIPPSPPFPFHVVQEEELLGLYMVARNESIAQSNIERVL